MKNILFALSLSAAPFLTASADVLEAKPVAEMIRMIEESTFKFQEHAMVFGYNSIQSCLYTSDQFIVIKNYCFPDKKYPAKSFTVVSPKFGIVEIYEEHLSASIHKRDVRIEDFSETLRKHLQPPLNDLKIRDLNKVFETLYYQYGPGCWSTNFDYNTHEPVANCTKGDVVDFEAWAAETQEITKDLKNWQIVMDRIGAKLK